MPPVVALALCLSFVALLLHLDRKQSPNLSIVSWLPTVWFLLITGKPLAAWFGVGGADLEAGSPLDRYLIGVLLLMGCAILAIRFSNWSISLGKNIWVIIILLYTFVSISWSDLPYASLKRFLRDDMAPIIMSFVMITEDTPRESLESILRRIVYILVPFSMLLIKYYPHLGVEYGRWSGSYMWIGVSLQKNGLATLCLYSILFLSWTLIRRWQGRNTRVVWYQSYVEVFLLVVALWLFSGPDHKLNYSATSSVALLGGIVAFVVLLLLKKRKKLIGCMIVSLLIWLIVGLGIIAPFADGLFLSDAASAFGRSETLTGRTDIWAYLTPYAMSRPLIGHGYGGFWTDAIRDATSSNAHNGYLDIILDLGFVGCILFGIFFVSSSRKAQKLMSIDFDWGVLWLCTVVIATIHNICESSTVSFTGTLAAIQISFFITFSSYEVMKAM